jgi:hypothetical protein
VVPRLGVVPYDNTLVDDSSVVQVIVRLLPAPDTVTAEITGGAVSATVKVAGDALAAGDTALLPAASAEDTRYE